MTSRLFVYGTLRWSSEKPMAQALRQDSRLVGPGTATGRLYSIADYPGFVPDPKGHPVHGDLVALNRPERMLDILDAYEECTPDFPEPHEYRREIIRVDTPDGPLEAWTYVYALAVAELEPIPSGLFMPR
jgi:gamma-glutamylcyclotransferase (GGCT)/AIG2-like uncharacterized protein YtfP